MKWVYTKRGAWRLVSDDGKWLGSVWREKRGEYYVDLAKDKWPYQLRKEIGPHTADNAKRILLAHVVGDRVSK